MNILLLHKGDRFRPIVTVDGELGEAVQVVNIERFPRGCKGKVHINYTLCFEAGLEVVLR